MSVLALQGWQLLACVTFTNSVTDHDGAASLCSHSVVTLVTLQSHDVTRAVVCTGLSVVTRLRGRGSSLLATPLTSYNTTGQARAQARGAIRGGGVRWCNCGFSEYRAYEKLLLLFKRSKV